MKAFIAEGTGAAQQLSGIQNEKIPIYGSKADAEADIENLEENQIVATKENGFSSDGVFAANSTSITGGELIANSSMKIMFTSDIVGADTSTPLSISWNGESYLVKVANNSQLQNIYAHEVSSGVFKYVQAYTTLELIFDGIQFIVVGNPLVLSSSTYSIYANGYNDFVNNCELSDIEFLDGTGNITGLTLSTTNFTCPYDGFIVANFRESGSEGQNGLVVNDNFYGGAFDVSGTDMNDSVSIQVKKGDTVKTYRGNLGSWKPWARWFTSRDYSNR